MRWLRLLDEFGEMQHIVSLANPPIELIGRRTRRQSWRDLPTTAGGDLPQYPDRFPTFVASLPMNTSRPRSPRSTGHQAARRLRRADVHNVAGKAALRARVPAAVRPHGAARLPVWVHPMRAAQFSGLCERDKTSEAEIWFSFGWPYETTAV